ncbi:MAG: hypothetical protein CL843_00245 [Crocinitomicaceae bacterium]|nr:hypothetical protein [Crocinitomicaceae bacterium]|tara:strand:+ start:1941 stop:5765 length:3825 start_codon:yes stop_codon:yes gene_type:complete
MKLFTRLSLIVAGVLGFSVSHAQVTITTSSQISSSTDDAEEDISSGNIDLTSSDLELSHDGNDDQYIGMRFTNIDIPQGVTITNAYIQFTCDETNNDSTSIYFFVEDTPTPYAYATTANEISSRPVMNDSVLWEDIPAWLTVHEAGADQRTPDLSSLIQLAVDQQGWASGNPISIIAKGVGERTAESYDGTSSMAPVLVVEYAPNYAPLGAFPIDTGAIWSYHDSGYAVASNWNTVGYNDSAWAFNFTEMGYGDGDEATVISNGSVYPTYYFRHNFDAQNFSQYDSLRVFLKYDDGAVVYLNGQEVVRENLPTGTIDYNTFASSAIGGTQESAFTTYIVANNLVNGTNTIAVEIHQASLSSSDVSFDLKLEGVDPAMAVDTFPLVAGSDWYFLDNGTDQDTTWKETSFDPYAEGWLQGAGQLGYGDGDETTVISYGPDANNKYITYYFYKELYVDTATLLDSVTIKLLRDDGAAVYVNGTRVVLDNLTAPYDYTTWSDAIVSGGDETTYFEYHFPKSLFIDGLNTVAVEIHQRDGTSSDLSFDLAIENRPETPVAGSGCTSGVLNHIGCFVSIDDIGQTQYLTIPESHAFQVIFQQGDQYDNYNGTVPGNHDFTGYVAINGSSTEGYIDVNHENTPGGVSVLDVHYDAANRLWVTDSINRVDMYTNNQVSTTRNCSGTVTPWGTTLTCEETYNSGDQNNDGYQDVGWVVEIDPVTRTVKNDTKHYAMGRFSHENAVIANDSVTVYMGEDGGSSCVFKYIADTPGDLSSGTLYVLSLDQSLSGGEPTGTTGQWVQVPNTTQNERNTTRALASSLGGTNFNGVEDCEISPVDGKVYFTAKGNDRVYRFVDNGTAVAEFETFVGGTSYNINVGGSVSTIAWGGGNDNLDFDDLGNLWVLQDGGNNYIWMVRPDHSQQNPKVELFASTPNGSEPTGSTFTPDYKFMFVSMQHPSGANGSFTDASGNTFAFDASTTVVIARKEYLGVYSPSTSSTNATLDNAMNCEQLDVNWTAGNGDRRIVIAKAGSAVDVFPQDGMYYNADATFGSGDDLGNGNYVIYDGTGSSVQVTGLSNQDDYYFAVVEYSELYNSTFYNNNNVADANFTFDAINAATVSGVTTSEVGELEIYSVPSTTGFTYDWSVTGGNIMSGQTTNAIAVEWTAQGTQTVEVVQTNAQGCEGNGTEYEVIIDESTGINEVTGETIYSIYPNPTSGVTTIAFEGNIDAEVALYGINGAQVFVEFTKQNNTVSFDAAQLQAGVYFINIKLDSGVTKTHRVVVK